MPWQGTHGFEYTAFWVWRKAPPQSGVYVLYRPNERPIYVGASGDIRTSLLEHLARDNDCIARQAPTLFAYELVPASADRSTRERALILELTPACNVARSPFRLPTTAA